ncbi:MAG: DUF169 domain-containing protein [Promethearchaeota archaeon]
MANLKYNIEQYQSVGRDYYDKLRLLTFPLAIKYIKEESEIPPNAFRPSKINQRLSLCQAFTTARRSGRTVGITFEDNHCITSSFVQGWEYMPGKEILKSQILSEYHSNPSAEMRIQLQFSELLTKESLEKIKGNIGFIVSPLPNTEIIPDIILTYGSPAQITNIIHALTYEGRFLVNNQTFLGYGESCIRGVLVPYLTNKSQVILPGTGDRTLAMTTENEMAFGMPASRLFYIQKNLFKSAANFNMGMPSKFMLFDMPFPMGPKAFRFLNRQYKRLQKGRLKK